MMMKNNLEEKKDMLLEEITEKLECLINGFEKVLYDDDDIFLQNMKTDNLAGDDVQKYRFWEWTQGVGLFGLWKQFEENRDEKALAMLKRYYDERIADGYYYSGTVALVKELLQHPELLELPASTPVEYAIHR